LNEFNSLHWKRAEKCVHLFFKFMINARPIYDRLANGFSKKLCIHKATVALYVTHYNLCRVHETLQVTPAMMLSVTDHVWSIDKLVAHASDGSK